VSGNTPVESDTSDAAPVEIAQAAPPASAQAEPAPQQNAPTPAPASLPETASTLPEIALLGLLFIGGAITARTVRRG
jgi:hypothetical protein